MSDYQISKGRKREIFKRIARNFMIFLKTLGLSLLITFPVGYMAMKGAYEQRGYMAVGGEWIIIIVTMGLSLQIIDRRLSLGKKNNRYSNT